MSYDKIGITKSYGSKHTSNLDKVETVTLEKLNTTEILIFEVLIQISSRKI